MGLDRGKIMKPKIIKIRIGYEISQMENYADRTKRNKFALVECPVCKEKHWSVLIQTKKQTYTGLCSTCNSRKNMHVINQTQIGINHPRWKGGRRKEYYGYVIILLRPDNPYYSMGDKTFHYVKEHRLVMAKYLGRCLESWEVIHHKNGIKDDNRIENLELLPDQSNHIQINIMKKKIKELEGKVLTLKLEKQLLLEKIRGDR